MRCVLVDGKIFLVTFGAARYCRRRGANLIWCYGSDYVLSVKKRLVRERSRCWCVTLCVESALKSECSNGRGEILFARQYHRAPRTRSLAAIACSAPGAGRNGHGATSTRRGRLRVVSAGSSAHENMRIAIAVSNTQNRWPLIYWQPKDDGVTALAAEVELAAAGGTSGARRVAHENCNCSIL